MKKLFVSLLVLGGLSGAAFAAEEAKPAAVVEKPAATVAGKPAAVDQRANEDWVPFQIAFWFDVPSYTKNSNVYGIKTGQPASSGTGKVCGLEASWVAAATDNISGIQGSWVSCFSKNTEGLQASLGFNRNNNYMRGAQGAMVCMAGDVHGLQASAVNVSDNVTGCQPAAIFNYSKDIKGCQLATIVNVSDKINGFQGGLINSATGVTGMQFGLINMSKSKGLQFGLLNFIDDAAVPMLPLVNFKF